MHEDNLRYAQPRSGYIHPLLGPGGEELTLDWSTDHPHHRGIYWAWPEVQMSGQTRDLHALQGVFSRPVGEPRVSAHGASARVEAENLWLWDDREPVVFERVVITARAASGNLAREIDIDLRFEALAEGITLARRGTDLYGGLNIRLAPVEGLELGHHAEAQGDGPARAWSWARGVWRGGDAEATLLVLEHPDNPDFPGDWITYENLPWFQPAFPRAGTRFELRPGVPLTLRYRLLVVSGRADEAWVRGMCDRYAAAVSPWSDDPPAPDSNEEHQ